MTENNCAVIPSKEGIHTEQFFESTADIIDSCLRRKDKIIGTLEKDVNFCAEA
jgi:hypothetical protein